MGDVEFRSEVRKGVISNFIFNVAINGGLTLWLLGGNETLPMWGDPAFGPDLLITGFLLSAIVAAIGMEVHRRKAKRGDMAVIFLIDRTYETFLKKVVNAVLRVYDQYLEADDLVGYYGLGDGWIFEMERKGARDAELRAPFRSISKIQPSPSP